ncbi:beta-N-acetylhexosaminidase [Lentibacter algarum]|uniref:beta-N-acetylhexosaminidase n=1 Tax=Lentibacter algarum TaxID=576131 RepID=UPI001C06852A|nr:beta-N-acetylhexosaminidase [Lentibacter algarum]MBU2982189.1 beta-N-acetylhexosaminidase [Lentibacter algarum]
MSRFGATILDADGLRLSADEAAFFREANPFGFILFARNIDNKEQVKRLCSEFREAVGRDAPITIDQEGGRVQRLRAPIWREWLPPLEQATLAGENAARSFYLRFRLLAHELHEIGIDSNCAPMVDIAGASTHEFLKNRCYGTDVEAVSEIGRAAADGMLDGGVLPVVKHVPGHGRAVADSHFELPTVQAVHKDLSDTDFAPFKALNDLPMGMTAHIRYPELDEAAATLSPKVMKIIRDEIGFDGLLMTDDISMKALDGDLGDLSRSALDAGCDVILHCNGSLDERRLVAEAAGEMCAEAQRRADNALDSRKKPTEIDIPAIEDELKALLNGRVYG